MLIRMILIALSAMILTFTPASEGRLDSGPEDFERKIQDLERRLVEEEAAHYLTKAKYQILEEKFSQLLFDSPREMELKAYYSRLLEEEFLVRLSEESIPWDTHEAYLILRIFRNFPTEVQGYFREGANPILTIKIDLPERVVDKRGSPSYGSYDPARHAISLSRSILRGSWFSFPSEILIRRTIAHELGHAYDRSRALTELKGAFSYAVPALSYYSVGNEEYRKIVEIGGNVHRWITFDTQDELIFENFAEVFEQYVTFRKRESLPTAEARYQYDFFYREVFCKEFLRVLRELEKENASLLAEKPSLIHELRDTALELTGSRHFCS